MHCLVNLYDNVRSERNVLKYLMLLQNVIRFPYLEVYIFKKKKICAPVHRFVTGLVHQIGEHPFLQVENTVSKSLATAVFFSKLFKYLTTV